MPEQRLLDYARQMRATPTDAEALTWRHLRGKRFLGYKFKRQQPLGCCIVDFASMKHRLVIEAYGGQHGDAIAHDAARTAWLAAQDFIGPARILFHVGAASAASFSPVHGHPPKARG